MLDIYAILNGGYSEYSEITASENEASKKAAKTEAIATDGFKLFNIGAKFAAEIEKRRY